MESLTKSLNGIRTLARLSAILSTLGILSHKDSSLAQVVTDGSLGLHPAYTFQGPNINISADFGTKMAGNLFHSFKSFSVPSGGVVTFSGPADVANILARVTGTELSRIDGKLASSITGANLFLMNPNGVLFGAGATLDVSGSFAATTAHQIEFDSGSAFTAKLSPDVQLSAATPAAFGFLGPSGTITVDKAQNLNVKAGHSLQLVGGDVTLDNGASVLFPGATALVVAQNEAGTIPVGTRDPVAASGTGQVLVTGGSILGTAAQNSEGTGKSGTLVIRAGRLRVDNAGSKMVSKIENDTTDSGNPATTDIGITGDVVIANGATIQSKALHEVGAGGRFTLKAGSILLENGGLINVDSGTGDMFTGHTEGDGTHLTVTANRLELSNGTLSAQTLTYAAGAAPVVKISAQESITMKGSASISMDSYGPSRSPATLELNTPTLKLEGSSIPGKSPTILAGTFGTAPGADVSIATDFLNLSDQSEIKLDALTGATGKAGNLVLNATEVAMEASAALSASTFGSGSGGNISLLATTRLLMKDSSEIRASTQGTGDGGDITITAHSVELKGSDNSGPVITASALLNRNTQTDIKAGNISISADQISIGRGSINTSTDGVINAGNIVLKSKDSITLYDRASLSSYTNGKGDSGNISVTSQNLILSEYSQISVNSTPSGQNRNDLGNAGTISINTTGITEIKDGSFFYLNSEGGGNGGNLVVGSGKFEMGINSQINSATKIGGHGGNIEINSKGGFELSPGSFITSSTLSSGRAGDITIRGDTFKSQGGTISSTTAGSGAGGKIALFASKSLNLSDSSVIESSTSGSGDAGSIEIVAGSVGLSSGGSLKADATKEGNAGNITITSETFQSSYGTISSTTAGSGAGGKIALSASKSLNLSDSSVIQSTTSGSGTAGSIEIVAGSVGISNGGSIKADATKSSRGNAGNITISSDTFQSSFGIISSTTAGSGTGGKIALSASKSLNLSDSSVIESMTSGIGSAGSIGIVAGSVGISSEASLNADAAKSSSGDAGDIYIDADTFQSQGGTISSRTDGTGDGGEIVLAVSKGIQLDDDNDGFKRFKTLIQTSTSASGSAGDISISAESISINAAEIESMSDGEGSAGSVSIQSEADFSLGGISQINVTSKHSKAGEISIFSGGDLEIEGPGPQMSGDGTRLESLLSSGRMGGRISLSALGSVRLRDCTLTARAEGPDAKDGGGTIEIPAGGTSSGHLPQMVLLDEVTLNASANGGPGGTILIATPAYVKSADTVFLFSNSKNELGPSGPPNTPKFEFQPPIEPPKFVLSYRDGIEWQEPSGWATRDREDYTRVGDLGGDREAGSTRRRIRLGR